MSEKEKIRIGFLTYLSRSGSTLLSRILNEYKEVCVTLEASLPAELFGIKGYKVPVFKNKLEADKYIQNLYKFSKLETWPVSVDEILIEISDTDFPATGQDLFRSLLTSYQKKVKPDSSIIIYKGSPVMPWNLIELHKNYPDALKLHILRDPRAVFASQKSNKLPYTNRNFANSPIEIAYDWKRSVEISGELGNETVIMVRYEDLILQTEHTVNTLLDRFSIIEPRKEKVLEFSELIPEQEKEIHTKISQKPDLDRLDAWKNELSSNDFKMMGSYLKGYLTRYNYETYSESDSLIIGARNKWEELVMRYRRSVSKVNRIAGYMIKKPGYLFKKISLLIRNDG